MRRLAWVLPVLAVCAQGQDLAPTAAQKRAITAMRLLELPARRYEAAAELWQLGGDAVAALASGLGDPRPEVVAIYLEVLRFVPVDDDDVLGRIDELRASDAPGVALRAFQCANAQAHRGKLVFVDFQAHRLRVWDGQACATVHEVGETAYDGDLLPDGGAVWAHRQSLCGIGPDGTEVWRVAGDATIDIDPLPGGRFLVGARGTNDAYEIDAAGKVHWRFAHDGLLAVEVERLADGRTLVCDHRPARAGGGVHVVDAAGTLLRTFECGAPSDAEPLADGGVVVASSEIKGVVVFAADGTERARFVTEARPTDLQVLPDGTLLVATDGRSVLRYDQQGALLGRVELEVGSLCAAELMAGGPLPPAVAESDAGR